MDYALLHLCSYGVPDRLDYQSGRCPLGSVQTTKSSVYPQHQGKMLFEKCFSRYCIRAGR